MNAENCLKTFPVSYHHVLDVSNRGSFLLSDNRQVKLSSVLMPYAPRDLPDGKQWPIFENSVRLMRSLSSEKNVRFVQSQKWANRYGVWGGHISIVSANSTVWLQKYLVQEGVVRVALTDKAFDCVGVLLSFEEKARQQKKGLWANNTYRVLSASDVWPLIRQAGTFQVIEGKVYNVAEVRGKFYLNFGKNWRKDFTVKISRRHLRNFRKKGIKPETYKGKTVRVRGWLMNRNGPLVEIEHPVLIEILNR